MLAVQARVGDTAESTGIAYDALQCKHECLCVNNAAHIERAERVSAVYTRLLVCFWNTILYGKCFLRNTVS